MKCLQFCHAERLGRHAFTGKVLSSVCLRKSRCREKKESPQPSSGRRGLFTLSYDYFIGLEIHVVERVVEVLRLVVVHGIVVVLFSATVEVGVAWSTLSVVSVTIVVRALLVVATFAVGTPLAVVVAVAVALAARTALITPMTALQLIGTSLISPEGRRRVAYLPSLAIS